MLMEQICHIQPVDATAYHLCQQRWNGVAKPVGSLGRLEELLCRIAAITRSPDVDISQKCVLVFCADNGVVAQGVAQSTQEVTRSIARSLLRETTSVNCMAKTCGATVYPVDMGMVEPVAGIRDCRLGAGTKDITQGSAMTREQAVQGICTGIQLVKEQVQAGCRLIGVGEAGIGNTTTSSAVTSVLLGQPVERVTGRGSGLSDQGMVRKQEAIRRAIARNTPNPRDPVDVLAKVGGFDLCGLVGAYIGGAIAQVPVVVDGFIAGAAALCAVRLCPLVRDYLLPSHTSAEPGGQVVLEALGFDPILHGGLRLGEGTGAVALFPLLDMAQAVYRQAATFADLEMEAYTPWER